MKNNLVKIVIPVYKVDLSEGEKKSLNRCVEILGNYPIVFAKPKSLDVSEISYNGLIESESFEDKYFQDVLGYNSLMLSEEFYSRFTDSEYILIYQLDAYVFRDALEEWCLKGYDYIGAPWIASKMTLFNKFLKSLQFKKKRKREIVFYKVGNGGFSLRKVGSSLKASQELKEDISKYLKRDRKDFWLMEDVYWSLRVPIFYPDFRIPNYKIALGFAIDRKPKLALKLNNNKLPFGCHGFEKPKVKEFWQDKIK